jgi:predicted signal transduction protein with EAL and GGDEF domain
MTSPQLGVEFGGQAVSTKSITRCAANHGATCKQQLTLGRPARIEGDQSMAKPCGVDGRQAGAAVPV